MPGRKHRFTTDQDNEAHAIALSELKAHPDMKWKKALSIGYGVVQKQINARKRMASA